MKRIFQNKKIRIAGLAIMLASMISVGIFMQSCSSEEEESVSFMESSELEVSDFKKWFESQEIINEFIGNREPNWNNAEIKLMRDGNSKLVSLEIYKGKNSSGNDSIIEIQVAYVKNSFRGGVKVYSFYNEEYAHAEYYSLSGQILEDGKYYAPKQLYMLLNRYTDKEGRVRLKSTSETSDSCNDEIEEPNSATPAYFPNGTPNPAAYNCHTYVWGDLSPNDTCYLPDHPHWNECPDISGSGYSEVNGEPQVGDRWVSYDYISNVGDVAIHSAIVMEVVNGKVTKLKAKCGQQGIKTYNPDCYKYASYMTTNIKYYR
jgi:hypothetical protein